MFIRFHLELNTKTFLMLLDLTIKNKLRNNEELHFIT
jgi:hypothetical protein